MGNGSGHITTTLKIRKILTEIALFTYKLAQGVCLMMLLGGCSCSFFKTPSSNNTTTKTTLEFISNNFQRCNMSRSPDPLPMDGPLWKMSFLIFSH